MKDFSIKELEILTGVKAPTLRIWERRYQALTPARTSGNNRIYSIHDLNKALNLALLTRSGLKISTLSRLGKDQLATHLLQLEHTHTGNQKIINELIMAMYRLDTERFIYILDNCLESHGMQTLLTGIIYPFLQRTGLLWKGNRLIEEHFVVTAIRNKIIHGIEQVNAAEKKNKTVLLFLPLTGQLDLSLLYTHFVLKSRGINVLYMGNDVTIENLKAVINLKKPDTILTYFSKKISVFLAELSTFMQSTSPLAQLILVKNPTVTVVTNKHANLHQLAYEDAITAACL